MFRFLGSRGASAVLGVLMLALSAGAVPAQAAAPALYGPPAPAAATRTIAATATPAPTRSLMSSVLAPVQKVVATVTAFVSPPQGVTSAIAREAAWLMRGGWPLYALVDRYSAGAPLDEQATCLATAVYFEARGESPEGQLAVARVVMNRAASGKYPPTWCSTIKQPAQFSFVRNGRFPSVNTGCEAWRKAQAIARLAMSNAVPSLANDVLWYHANYVAPSWGRRLTRADKIGAHIFYRA